MTNDKDALLLGAFEDAFPVEVSLIRDKIDEMEEAALVEKPKGARLQALAAGIKHRIAMLQIAAAYNPLQDIMDVVDKVTRAKRAGTMTERDAAKVTRELSKTLGVETKETSLMDALAVAYPSAVSEIMSRIETLECEAMEKEPKGAKLQTLASGIKYRVLMLQSATGYNPAKDVMDVIDKVTRAKRAGTMTERDAVKVTKEMGRSL